MKKRLQKIGTILACVCLLFNTAKASLTLSASVTPACTSDGSATITLTGALASTHDFYLTGRPTTTLIGSTAVFNSLPPGNYSLFVLDAGGLDSASILFTIPTVINTNATITNAACPILNGSVTTAVTGGTAPYTYNWSTGATTPNLTSLNPGTYRLTITDNAGCMSINEYLFQGLIANRDTFIQPDCLAPNSGQIGYMVVNGNYPYTYTWSTGVTYSIPNEATNLTAGTYGLTITDAVGCTYTVSNVLNQISGFNATLTTTPSDCNPLILSGTATASVSGLTYDWTSGGVSIGHTQSITGLASGQDVKVIIKKSLSCTDTLSGFVTYDPTCLPCKAIYSLAPDITPHTWNITNSSYNTTTYPLTYSWFWGDGSSSIGIATSHTYSAAGSYHICLTVDNGHGCVNIYCDTPDAYISKTEQIIKVNVIDSTHTATGVETLKSNLEVTISPNPTQGLFNIEVTEAVLNKNLTVEIYSVLGNLITKMPLEKTKTGVDISQAPSGIYVIKLLEAAKTSVCKRISKE